MGEKQRGHDSEANTKLLLSKKKRQEANAVLNLQLALFALNNIKMLQKLLMKKGKNK